MSTIPMNLRASWNRTAFSKQSNIDLSLQSTPEILYKLLCYTACGLNFSKCYWLDLWAFIWRWCDEAARQQTEVREQRCGYVPRPFPEYIREKESRVQGHCSKKQKINLFPAKIYCGEINVWEILHCPQLVGSKQTGVSFSR